MQLMSYHCAMKSGHSHHERSEFYKGAKVVLYCVQIEGERMLMRGYQIAFPIETPETACPLMGMEGDFAANAATLEKLGYRYVELLVRDAAELERTDYETVLSQRHLQPVAITTAAIQKQDGLSLLHANPAKSGMAMVRIMDMLPLAAHWGIPLCIGRNRGMVSDDPGCTMTNLVHIMTQLGKAAEKAGVTLALEPQTVSNVNNLNTVDEAISFIQALDTSAVGLHLDTYHMELEEADLITSIKRAGSYIAFVHIADTDRKVPGEGSIRFGDVITALKSVGYEGALSAEIKQSPDSKTVAERYMKAMKKLL